MPTNPQAKENAESEEKQLKQIDDAIAREIRKLGGNAEARSIATAELEERKRLLRAETRAAMTQKREESEKKFKAVSNG